MTKINKYATYSDRVCGRTRPTCSDEDLALFVENTQQILCGQESTPYIFSEKCINLFLLRCIPYKQVTQKWQVKSGKTLELNGDSS